MGMPVAVECSDPNGKIMKKLLFTLLSLAAASTLSAQSTNFYILNGDANAGFIVRNGAVQSTFTLNGPAGAGPQAQYALRVNSSGMVVADRDGSKTTNYTLSGVAGSSTSNPGQSLDQFLDGGTDGTFTYAARCCSNADGIYKGNMNFGGMTQLVSGFQASGVTYGAGFVWATAIGDNVLRQFTTGGSLVNSWNLGSLGNSLGALAYESSTNSLWFGINNSNSIYNYSLTGQQLNHLNVDGLGGNFWAGEMIAGDAVPSTVPEPSTYALMAAGLAAVAAVGRRRRRTV